MNLNVNWKKIAIVLSGTLGSFLLYRRYILPVMIANSIKNVHQKVHGVKKKTFDEAFQVAKSNTGDVPLDILEVGVGPGSNFTLFPRDAKISFLDNTEAFLPYLKKSFQNDNRSMDDFKLIVAGGENMSIIESNSKDVVVHTFLLCSVNDPRQVLKEIHRVLKPGGVCVFIEHSLNTEDTFLRCLQRLVTPIWLVCFTCKFLPIKKLFEESNFISLKVDYFRPNGFLMKLVGPFVYGFGIKE